MSEEKILEMWKGRRWILLFIGNEAWYLKQWEQPWEATWHVSWKMKWHDLNTSNWATCQKRKKEKKKGVLITDNTRTRGQLMGMRNKYSSSLSCQLVHIRNYKNWAISISSKVLSKSKKVVQHKEFVQSKKVVQHKNTWRTPQHLENLQNEFMHKSL